MSSSSTSLQSENASSALPVIRENEIGVALLTGGFDRPYAYGLAMALSSQNIYLDVIGSDEVDSPEMHTTPGLSFLKLQENPRSNTGFLKKLTNLTIFYLRLFRYALNAKPKIFHILWNNKVQLFDRTLLMLYYKMLGKKLVFTAHNVNAGKRDGNDSFLNRLTLRVQYHLADHIFVHTAKMHSELQKEFGISKNAATVIPFGINNSVPDTHMTSDEARQKLGIGTNEKVILFFGAIRPYKGLEHLVAAFQKLAPKDQEYRLIIAGESKKGSEQYTSNILEMIENGPGREHIIQKIEFIPDEETELYFKAADVSVLSYTLVFQSGVLFLSYSFGLPVVAADVGSFREEVVSGETGFLCRSCDPGDLSEAIEKYFASELFKNLKSHRQKIKDYANSRNSWGEVATTTRSVYTELLGGNNL